VKIGALLIVKWLDHCGSTEWTTREAAAKTKVPVATTIGWLVFQDDDKLILSNSNVDDDIGGVDVIIQSCITEIEEIEIL